MVIMESDHSVRKNSKCLAALKIKYKLLNTICWSLAWQTLSEQIKRGFLDEESFILLIKLIVWKEKEF